MTSTLKLLLVAALSTAPLHANDEILLVDRDGFTRVEIVDVEVDAGAVVRLERTDLESITPVPYSRAYRVASIGPQVWMGTEDGVLRYEKDVLTGYAWLDRVLTGRRCVGVWPEVGGALVLEFDAQSNRLLHRVDATGAIQQTVPLAFGLDDIIPFQGGYLAISGFAIQRLDAGFNVVGPFASGAPGVAAGMGLGYTPETLTVLRDGRIAVSAFSSVAILRPDESVYGIVDVGQFERGARETAGGLLVVPCFDGTKLLDPDTLEAFEVGGALTGDDWNYVTTRTSSPAAPDSTRYCVAVPNSTGRAARVHLLGATDAAERTLSAVANSMPANTFAVPIFGTASFNAAYGDGRLCVSPFAAGITRGAVVSATSSGSAQSTFDFLSTQTGAAFLPGTSWYFQFIYRDGGGAAGFNATDGVSITFQP